MTKEVPSKIEAGGILHRLPVFVHCRQVLERKILRRLPVENSYVHCGVRIHYIAWEGIR